MCDVPTFAALEACTKKLVNAYNRAATLESINRGLEKDLQAIREERLELQKECAQLCGRVRALESYIGGLGVKK